MITSLILVITTLHLAECQKSNIVNVEKDFNKLKTDPELSKHVSEILIRLKTFRVPIHPRIRLFYQLLKKGMAQYADRTADTIFVPHRYNIQKPAPVVT